MRDFKEKLIIWYTKYKRDLPWRKTHNPYHIWVSEVILQQTRINQGISYYRGFIAKFPDVNTLATANKDEILKIWQGLGYYNRALNMHSAAKTVANEFNGIFPSDYHQLIRLKGIGDYTASAIASIAGNQPYAVVDSNVTRVLSRIFGVKDRKKSIFEKKIKTTAAKLLDKKQAGTFNQALMEFGALQCKPSPDCSRCIFNNICYAFTRQQLKEYPPKKKVLPKKVRYFHYFIIYDRDHLYIQNRQEKDIWAGLFEFPLIETNENISNKRILNKFLSTNTINPEDVSGGKEPATKQSILSHQIINLSFHELKLKRPGCFSQNNWIKVKNNKLDKYAFPAPLVKYLKDKEFWYE